MGDHKQKCRDTTNAAYLNVAAQNIVVTDHFILSFRVSCVPPNDPKCLRDSNSDPFPRVAVMPYWVWIHLNVYSGVCPIQYLSTHEYTSTRKHVWVMKVKEQDKKGKKKGKKKTAGTLSVCQPLCQRLLVKRISFTYNWTWRQINSVSSGLKQLDPLRRTLISQSADKRCQRFWVLVQQPRVREIFEQHIEDSAPSR